MDGPITLHAGETAVAFAVDGAGVLRQLGFGTDVPDTVGDLPVEVYPLAYPTFGEDPFALPALRITHGSGALTTRLVVDAVHRTPHDDGETLVVSLVDPVQPVTLRSCWKSWRTDGFLEAWVELTNDQTAPITVHEMAAATPALGGTDPHLDSFAGSWAGEFVPIRDRLTFGAKVFEARATTRPNHEVAPHVHFSPDGPTQETTGSVLSASVLWGGNIRIAFERNVVGHTRAWFGHLPTGADYRLDPGATLCSPRVRLGWSSAGLRPLIQRGHRWVRAHALRDGDRERAIVANNWEATGFAFDQERLVQLCADTADVGAELFLLDDGWFGDEFPRDDDTAGLGDWMVDLAKLPGGLEAIGDAARVNDVRFGVWVEPEMVNPRSALYRDHPDWVVTEPGRERREERQQLQLDLCRPEVREHVLGVFDGVLTPQIGASFVKWDANRMVTEPGSSALPADRQGNWPVDVVRATWSVMAEVAEAHPDTELLLCASGGGRIDLGTLGYFHEVWLSDNTDPVDRVRMQWQAASLLPAMAVASHVTLWGMRPMPFACAVAMSARFGFDVNRQLLDDRDWRVLQRASAAYRRIRPVVQFGDLCRLLSPEQGDSVAVSYLTPDATRGVVFGFRLPPRGPSVFPAPGTLDDDPPRTVRLAGLDQDRVHRVTPIDLTSDEPVDSWEATGASLCTDGLTWDRTDELTACIWEIEVVTP